MEAVIRKFENIDASERRYLETALGRQLQAHQQVVIRVIDVGVEPDKQTRQAALSQAAKIAQQGREHAQGQGIAEQEVDAAIEEALTHARRHAE